MIPFINTGTSARYWITPRAWHRPWKTPGRPMNSTRQHSARHLPKPLICPTYLHPDARPGLLLNICTNHKERWYRVEEKAAAENGRRRYNWNPGSLRENIMTAFFIKHTAPDADAPQHGLETPILRMSCSPRSTTRHSKAWFS